MATTQIEESRLAQLEKDAERVQTLESERADAVARAEKAEQLLAESARTNAATGVITAAESEHGIRFSDLERRGILAALPVTESGDLDEDALTKTVVEAATVKAEAAGAGSPRGISHESTADLVESADAAIAGAFGRQVKEA